MRTARDMPAACFLSGSAHLLTRLVRTDGFATKALLSPLEDAFKPGTHTTGKRLDALVDFPSCCNGLKQRVEVDDGAV